MTIINEMNENFVECQYCESQMKLTLIRKFPGFWPYVLICLGFVFTLFVVGAILGIPILLTGIYMLISRETISLCPGCGAYFQVLVLDDDSTIKNGKE